MFFTFLSHQVEGVAEANLCGLFSKNLCNRTIFLTILTVKVE